MLAAPIPLTRGYEHLFPPPLQFPGRRTLVEFLQHPRQSDWEEQSDAKTSTGVSSPGSPVSPCTGLGIRMAWFPFRPSGQLYVVLPQAWVSPYRCLNMLPPFGQDVASIATFSGRPASPSLLPSCNKQIGKTWSYLSPNVNIPSDFSGERNSGLAISSSDVLSGPCGHQSYKICTGAMGRFRPFAWHLSVTRSLVSICMPQGYDRMEGTETLCPHATILNQRWLPGTRTQLLSIKPDEWIHLSPFYTCTQGEWLRYAKFTSQYSLPFSHKVRDDWGFQVNPQCSRERGLCT